MVKHKFKQNNINGTAVPYLGWYACNTYQNEEGTVTGELPPTLQGILLFCEKEGF